MTSKAASEGPGAVAGQAQPVAEVAAGKAVAEARLSWSPD